MFFPMGQPSPSLRYVAGKVTDTATDTATVLINGEDVPGVAVLGDMPDVGDLVDVYQLDDLLYIPASSGMVIVHHGTDGTVLRPSATWVLWLGTAEPVNAKPYDGWEEADI